MVFKAKQRLWAVTQAYKLSTKQPEDYAKGPDAASGKGVLISLTVFQEKDELLVKMWREENIGSLVHILTKPFLGLIN